MLMAIDNISVMTYLVIEMCHYSYQLGVYYQHAQATHIERAIDIYK